MRVLVTGGGGFLGGGIAHRLMQNGCRVSVLGRSNYTHLDAAITLVRADIRDREAVSRAVKEKDVVFHVAAIPGIWGDSGEFYGINVEGTRNVIDACWEQSVKKLIYTSSPSVVFRQTDMENIDESVPYPSSYLCDYPQTKAIAEKMVLQANGVNGLSTVSLRPHLIWGPGDPHLIPRLLDRAGKGRLVQVGNGDNRVDMIYIDNAVEAHLQACDALEPGSPVAGQCYFISDGHPVVLWEWINGFLRALNQPQVTRSISYPTAKWVGAILESVYRILNIKSEPPMTRFLASQLATSHYFDISKARKDFGYAPVVSPEEGMKKLIKSLSSHPEG